MIYTISDNMIPELNTFVIIIAVIIITIIIIFPLLRPVDVVRLTNEELHSKEGWYYVCSRVADD